MVSSARWVVVLVLVLSGGCDSCGHPDPAVPDGPVVAADTEAPTWGAGAVLTAVPGGPTSLAVAFTAASDNVGVTAYRVSATGVADLVLDASARGAQLEGLTTGLAYTIQVEAGDAAGNWSTTGPSAVATPLVPDPTGNAPPLDPHVATTMAASAAFLTSGADPSQIGVAPGAIDLSRVVIVRGRVVDRAGAPIAAVTVSVVGQPGLGHTSTGADGWWNLALNAGGPVAVALAKPAYITAQRQFTPSWKAYTVIEDVVLIGYDSAVTAITSGSSSLQVARGSPVTDVDGTRRATLMFAVGTHATMVDATGATTPLVDFHVRATEYTVGPSGPRAMPASLPPTSGYTYAVEISVDEAVAAGAVEVRLDQPAAFYLESFIDFPVGDVVPTGWYDRVNARWVPAPGGRIIAVVAEASGAAQLDADGDGDADAADDARLIAMGVSAAERIEVANLYAPGDHLWRVPLDHFTPWDCNWPFGPPDDAEPPYNRRPPAGPRRVGADDPAKNSSCRQGGSIIGCEEQSLGEAVAVRGTPYALHYQSDRNGVGALIEIPLTGDSVPANVVEIRVEVVVAGQKFEQTFAPAPNLTYRPPWNGLDAFGRHVQGRQLVEGTIGFRFPAVYYPVRGDFLNSFARFAQEGQASPTRLLPVRGRGLVETVSRWRRWARNPWRDQPVNAAEATDLGGWSLSVHHHYDPEARTVVQGDGTVVYGEAIDRMITTLAGRPPGGSSGPAPAEGDPALGAFINAQAVAVAPDGTVYFGDLTVASNFEYRVRRISPDGRLYTVAGIAGPNADTGDGGPATAAGLFKILDLAVGRDGSLYIATGPRIRRITPDGIIHTVAGTGVTGSTGDGGPATLATIETSKIAIGPDDTIYLDNAWPRRIGADGIITSFTGPLGLDATTQPALTSHLASVGGIGIAPSGALAIAEGYFVSRLRLIRPDSLTSVLAGRPDYNYDTFGDGGPATAAYVNDPRDPVFDADGALYFANKVTTTAAGSDRVRTITTDGIIQTIAGGGTSMSDGAALGAYLNEKDLAMGPNGTLFVAEFERVRMIQYALGGGGGTLTVPSADGAQIFVFDPAGRHLRTLDAFTGAVQLSFGYDPAGRLVTVTDVADQVTTIERDAAGFPIAVVAPTGQRTALAIATATGMLATITEAGGAAHAFTYDLDGLMRTYTDPRGGAHAFTYELGTHRLTHDADAAAGGSTLARTSGVTTGHSVVVTSAAGRATTYTLEELPTGGTRRTITTPAGLKTETDQIPGGITVVRSPDGTVSTRRQEADRRFGMIAPYDAAITIAAPGGRQLNISAVRTTELDLAASLRLVRETDAATVNGKTTTIVRDAVARTITTTSPLGRVAKTTYDALGRATVWESHGNLPRIATYDAVGQIATVAQGARTTTYAHDAAGNVTRVTDALGHQRALGYDAAGRVTSVADPGGAITSSATDASGNLIARTPPGRAAHTFDYDLGDRGIAYRAPGQAAVQQQHDLDGQLTRITRRDGSIIDLTYDAGGRLATRVAGVQTISYAYAPVTGHLASVTHGEGAMTIAHSGRLITGQTWTGTIAGDVGFGHDANDLRITQRVGAQTVAFSYDDDGLIIGAGALTYGRGASSGAVTSATAGVVASAVVTSGYGELTSITTTVNATPLFDVSYTRDPLGRVLTRTENLLGDSHTTGYGYDADGRLVRVTRDLVETEAYAYDPNGNRIARNGVAATFDGLDRVLTDGGTSYAYDAHGARATRTDAGGATTYGYDGFGNLVAVARPVGGAIAYVVDGDGQRIGKKVGGALAQGFLYDDRGAVIAELDGASAVVAVFVYGARRHAPDLMIKGGATYRILADPTGSPRLVVDIATGAIAQRLEYDGLGRVTLDTAPGFQPFGFAGGLYDRDTRLVRLGARDYDPEVGVWTSPDPLLFAAGDANVYAYVGGDPVNNVDPSGLGPDSVTQWEDSIYSRGTAAVVGVSGAISMVGGWSAITAGTWSIPTTMAAAGAGAVATAPLAAVTLTAAAVSYGVVNPTLRMVDRAYTRYSGQPAGADYEDWAHRSAMARLAPLDRAMLTQRWWEKYKKDTFSRQGPRVCE